MRLRRPLIEPPLASSLLCVRYFFMTSNLALACEATYAATCEATPRTSQELHERYYEPRARVAASLAEVLAGPPVKKLLFMTDPHTVDSVLRPNWEACARPQPPAVLQTGASGSRGLHARGRGTTGGLSARSLLAGWVLGGAAAARACAAAPAAGRRPRLLVVHAGEPARDLRARWAVAAWQAVSLACEH